MKLNKKSMKAIVLYIILLNIALFFSEFRFLIWESKLKNEVTNVTEEGVVSGMSFIDTQPRIRLICNYFTGFSILKKNFVYKIKDQSSNISCPLIYRL